MEQIRPPRVPFVDPKSGIISREWYRWLMLVTNAFDDSDVSGAFDAATGISAISEAEKGIADVSLNAQFPYPIPSQSRDIDDVRLLDRAIVPQTEVEEVRLLDRHTTPEITEARLQDIMLLSGLRDRSMPQDATEMVMKRIGNSTYYSVQHLQDIFHSSGHVSGGTIADAGSGNITVTAGTGLIRASQSGIVTVSYFDWAALGATAITANTIRYVGVEYNSGSPQVVVRTTYNWNFFTDFPLGSVVNESGTLHVLQSSFSVGDHASKMIQEMYGTMPFARDGSSGLILGETGTRNLTVSAGAMWNGLTKYTISAIDTSASSTFDSYYRNGGGGWTKVASQTQWPNTQYDNNSGTLQTMTANRYAVLWFYLEADSQLVMLYGQNEYTTLSAAEEETAPSAVPNRVTAHGRLIARLAFQKSDATAQSIASSFDTMLSPTAVTDHGGLAGLTDDDHTQYLLVNGTRGLSAAWDAGSWQIRAETFQSDVATGTAPLTVASTTKVTNLNADLLDDQTGSYYLDSANFTGTNWTDLTDSGATTLHKHDHGGQDGLTDDDHTQYWNSARGAARVSLGT